MLSFEQRYRQDALTIPPRVSLGSLRSWVGRFYLGIWGVVAVVFGVLGAAIWFWQVIFLDPTHTGNFILNFIRGQIAAPPPSIGMKIPTTPQEGLWWWVVMVCATVTFVAWMLRQVDVSRQLRMGYHVPIAYGAVVTSWVTIQILRPALLGRWAEGFPLGVMAHLDWLSAFGYRYFNFYYNPFHALGVALLYGSAFVLSLHGATILSGAEVRKQNADVDENDINRFYWDFLGYSIGEIGIHRLAFFTAVLCVLVSNLCIVFSGTLVQDWNRFWDFWNRLPFWSGFGF